MAKRTKRQRTASTGDRWALYEQAVQEPEADCEFIEQVWRELRGRRPRHLREDFCGTAVDAIEWVRRGRRNTAIAVDISPTVLQLAEQRAGRRLKPAERKRLQLVEADVLKVKTPKTDTICACNFSYFTFKTRETMRRYFRRCRDALVDDGLLLLDAYGGSDAFRELRERREVNGFTYIWDQHHYNPITGHVINHIHFRFPDGTRIREAFTYDWRLWTLPELRELLLEAGFRDVTVYWEGTEEGTTEGNGIFKPSQEGEACEGWIAYLVAEK